MENAHWLVKDQLARRGGRKGQNRVPPDAADGYIADLSQTHAKVGGGSRSTVTIRDGRLMEPDATKTTNRRAQSDNDDRKNATTRSNLIGKYSPRNNPLMLLHFESAANPVNWQ